MGMIFCYQGLQENFFIIFEVNMTTPIRMVYTTTDDGEVADRLAKTMIERRLAACVKIVPKVSSYYRWRIKFSATANTGWWLKPIIGRSQTLSSLSANSTTMIHPSLSLQKSLMDLSHTWTGLRYKPNHEKICSTFLFALISWNLLTANAVAQSSNIFWPAAGVFNGRSSL